MACHASFGAIKLLMFIILCYVVRCTDIICNLHVFTSFSAPDRTKYEHLAWRCPALKLNTDFYSLLDRIVLQRALTILYITLVYHIRLCFTLNIDDIWYSNQILEKKRKVQQWKLAARVKEGAVVWLCTFTWFYKNLFKYFTSIMFKHQIQRDSKKLSEESENSSMKILRWGSVFRLAINPANPFPASLLKLGLH